MSAVIDSSHFLNDDRSTVPWVDLHNQFLERNPIYHVGTARGAGGTSTTLSNGSTVRHHYTEPGNYPSMGSTTSINVPSMESWIRENLQLSVKLKQVGNDLEVEVSLSGPNDSLISRDFDRISLDELRT